ncbi:hypothetical protein BM221_000227 [Beauveria bassiana]|uniref:Uncharacterized protein n=1 Tax=Beauveria bassiana TaxID=176275 RepID=A0A2N6NZY1_BEABA|nr:hypothetical protein BM221_000227 [Beauveria bassiana]
MSMGGWRLIPTALTVRALRLRRAEPRHRRAQRLPDQTMAARLCLQRRLSRLGAVPGEEEWVFCARKSAGGDKGMNESSDR